MNWMLILGWLSLSGMEEKGEFPAAGTDSLQVEILNYDQLKPLLHLSNDTTYVIHFWATWCAPCVKELPYFVALDSVHRSSPFKLLLVSLDFKKDYFAKLQPFVESRGLQEYVVVLEDKRSNFWIDDIDPSWSGAIPATLVYRGAQRSFYERTFDSLPELNEIVKPFLNL